MPRPVSRPPSVSVAAVGVSILIVLAGGIATAATESWHGSGSDAAKAPTATSSPSPVADSPSPSAPSPSSSGPSSDAPSAELAPSVSPVSPVVPVDPVSTSVPVALPTPVAVPTAGSGSSAPGSPAATVAGVSPGTYRYDESSTFTSRDEKWSTQVTSDQLVSKPGDNGYQGVDQDRGRIGLQASVRVDADGIHLRKLHVSFPPVSKTFAFSPSELVVPLPSAGAPSWKWKRTSTDGQATLTGSGSITGTTTDEVGGRAVRVSIVKTTLHLKGNGFDITIVETDHLDEAARVLTQSQQVARGTITGVPFTSTISDRLRSLTPS